MWQRLRALVIGDVARTFVASEVLVPFGASLIVVLAGISFSVEFLAPPRVHLPTQDVAGPSRDLASAMSSWDGARYAAIASEGYEKDEIKRAVSFPAYPFLARAVSTVLSCPQDVALLITSNLAFLVACAFLYRYVLVTRPDATPRKVAALSVALVCFWPLALFFHVGYSESLFLAAVIVAFYGMERRWPAPAVGAVIGLATGTRLVGLALVLVFADHLIRSGRFVERPFSAAAGILLSCWGIVGFLVLQQLVYGDSLMFITAQRQFVLDTDMPIQERILRLVTLEPVWSVFNPASRSHWESFASSENPAFNVRFLNPIVFCTFSAIAGIGWWKGVVRRGEALYCVVTLGLPYVTHAIQGGMLSQARYALVAFPVFIVLATMCRRAPQSMVISALCIGAALLFAFSALFGASYAVF